MMKLVMSVVLLLCVGAEQVLMAPISDISEFQKIKDELKTLHDEVKELRSKNEERVNVAFSASLLGSDFIGPYSKATTLVYKNIFTNIGNAYNSNTGIFTAPVKGVYFFNFVVFNLIKQAAGVRLLKNDELVVAASDNPSKPDTEDTACNSVTLLLEKWDQVHLQLIENRQVYTDGWRRNTFSGHLLFTVSVDDCID